MINLSSFLTMEILESQGEYSLFMVISIEGAFCWSDLACVLDQSSEDIAW